MNNQQHAKITEEGFGVFTKPEVDWIRATFKEKEFALKTLRKFFLPRLDENADVGEIHDIWLQIGDELGNTDPRERMDSHLAWFKTIKHIEAKLVGLKTLSEMEEETDDERTERLRKDSTK